MKNRDPLTELTPSHFGLMNLPKEFWDASVDEIPEKARSQIKHYCSQIDSMFEKGMSIQFMGPKGSGKTSAAVVVAKIFRMNFYPVYFTSLVDLKEAAKTRYDFTDKASPLTLCRSIEVLILDDLTFLDATDRFFNSNNLRDLLVSRGQQKKVTLLTSSDEDAKAYKAVPAVAGALGRYFLDLSIEGPDRSKDVRAENKKQAFGLKTS